MRQVVSDDFHVQIKNNKTGFLSIVRRVLKIFFVLVRRASSLTAKSSSTTGGNRKVQETFFVLTINIRKLNLAYVSSLSIQW